jgi:hypothetical protein
VIFVSHLWAIVFNKSVEGSAAAFDLVNMGLSKEGPLEMGARSTSHRALSGFTQRSMRDGLGTICHRLAINGREIIFATASAVLMTALLWFSTAAILIW